MGWATRKGKRYYYRKERDADGRVRSIFCGGGERGEAAARADEARRLGCATTEILEKASIQADELAELGRKKEVAYPSQLPGEAVSEYLSRLRGLGPAVLKAYLDDFFDSPKGR